jgi:uncharacterized protein (DUF302 family)
MAGTGEGMERVESRHSVEETVQRLRNVLAERGVTIFAVIDHSGEAARAGLTMLPTQVVVFGNPAAGTPVMLAAPSIAIDLPLRVLVWEDADGKVWAAWNTPEYLRDRHGVPEEYGKVLGAAGALARAAAE